MLKMKKSKVGQVWIETVLYTLIGLSLIGIILAIVLPKISEAKDRIVIEQTMESLNVLDEKINDVIDRGPGNVRIIPEFKIKRGSLYIDGLNDKIVFKLDELKKPYSEPNVQVQSGKFKVFSEEKKKGDNNLTITLEYSGKIDLAYETSNKEKKLSAAGIPYKLSIENLGVSNSLLQINIEEISRG